MSEPETHEEREARLFLGQQLAERRWAGWLHAGSFGVGHKVRPPSDFLNELRRIADDLIELPDWRAWWVTAERPRLVLYCFFESDPSFSKERDAVRRRSDEVEVVRVFTASVSGALGVQDAEAFLREVFADVARRYKMPPPPELG